MDKPYRLLADLLNNPPSLGALSRSGFGLGTPPPLGARPTQPRDLIAGALRQPGIAAFHAQNSPLARYASALKANKQAHDRLLGVLMSLLSKLGSGFDLLTADLQGWSKPERIYWVTSGKGHVPDATAWYGYTKYIFEVETADTIAIDHTRQQCELFAAYVRQHGGKFALFVPAGEETRARLQLAHWSISAEVW